MNHYNNSSTQSKIEDFEEINALKSKLSEADIPNNLKEKAFTMIKRTIITFKYGGNPSGFDQIAKYIDMITSLPWKKRSPDNLDIQHAKQILDRHHYGLENIKNRILEYLSVMKLNIANSEKDPNNHQHNFMRAPILFFVGLVGTGKTTIAKSIAESMNRQFTRIPFGGMGSAQDLRGQSKVHPDAEAGLLIKSLKRAGTKNPVILLDELDRVTEQARADIMGVLVELLDPEQNQAFIDHYIDFPFDLSEVLFVATANNTKSVSTAVMDRLEPIQMPSYTDDEKIAIAKSYLFPKVLKSSGLNSDKLSIEDNVWPTIVRPLGFDSGIRTLERTINGVCRKVARQIVEGKGQSFHINNDNVKNYLPKW